VTGNQEIASASASSDFLRPHNSTSYVYLLIEQHFSGLKREQFLLQGKGRHPLGDRILGRSSPISPCPSLRFSIFILTCSASCWTLGLTHENVHCGAIDGDGLGIDTRHCSVKLRVSALSKRQRRSDLNVRGNAASFEYFTIDDDLLCCHKKQRTITE
jgi:hypothetical protein